MSAVSLYTAVKTSLLYCSACPVCLYHMIGGRVSFFCMLIQHIVLCAVTSF